MQVLNFVPEDYIQKKLTRKANMLCALLAGIVCLALVVMFVALAMAQDSLADELQAADSQVSQASTRVAEWTTFRDERKELLAKADRAARLLVPLPRSRIVAEIVKALPQRTTLVDLMIKEETTKVIESATKKRAAPGSKSTPLEQKEQTVTRMRVLGLAPTDVQVAQLIAALSNSAFFDQVELAFSEDQVADQLRLRRFEVHFNLSNDAYRLVLEGAAKEESQ